MVVKRRIQRFTSRNGIKEKAPEGAWFE